MNNKYKELADQAHDDFHIYYEQCRKSNTQWEWDFEQRFAELLIREHLDILRNQWYDLNNLPVTGEESPRDIGIRVGRKTEVNVLMDKIRKHFGIDEN